MSARYRLTLAIEFTAGDDPAARGTVTRNLDILEHVAQCLRDVAYTTGRSVDEVSGVKLKLQRLNDDAPPRALVVEVL